MHTPTNLEAIHSAADEMIANMDLRSPNKDTLFYAAEAITSLYAEVIPIGSFVRARSSRHAMYIPSSYELSYDDKVWSEYLMGRDYVLEGFPEPEIGGYFQGMTIKRQVDVPPFRKKEDGFIVGYVALDECDARIADDTPGVLYFSPAKLTQITYQTAREACNIPEDLKDTVDAMMRGILDFQQLAHIYAFLNDGSKREFVTYLNSFDLSAKISTVTLEDWLAPDAWLQEDRPFTMKRASDHYSLPIGTHAYFCYGHDSNGLDALMLQPRTGTTGLFAVDCARIVGHDVQTSPY